MDARLRKRKGAKSSSFVESNLSGDRQCKRKCGEREKIGSCNGGPGGGIVMTAPPIGCSLPGTPARGLKRKLGCIDSATRIGRKKKLEHEYVLGRDIGHGKFGSVRLCWCKASGEEFACKTLPKNGEESVHREVEIMQHLSGHPGIVMLKAVYEDSECFHLVMEFCSGGRLLDQMVKQGRFLEQRVAKMLKELISVIKYCHEMGVVHRDIKPENILLTEMGKMKLADFGLAVRVTDGQKLSGVAGSPAYVAPEVLSGYYSEKVDIWGAGVLLHALLVGALPFQGDSLEAVFEAIRSVQLDFHKGVWNSISEPARDLISRMLTRDVSARMTADEILRHPWIIYNTDHPSTGLPNKLRITPRKLLDRIDAANDSAQLEFVTTSSEFQDESGFVDALAVAISCVTISEPKRGRFCTAPPIEPECSSNMKANLCTAF
ncbi:serine/threonine-protein kinase PEPKR2 [Canna indica]|uniref:Serine/threonine-protein kinase PEPKR2 n=1 Tax=Canna indica TaxID=4628 RepID=A0AAQ3KD93_9LILI|nr:serine/threonine-protein kinase PEPKR2 [Canna indica]